MKTTPQQTDLQALGIARVPVVFVNAYLVDINPGVPGDGWVLVDTGLRGLGDVAIRRAAAMRYGPDVAPRAIVVTHGHFDHAGSAHALASRGGVSVFAHPLELPYLTGRSDYPPPDPTVGGALAMMSRAFPHGGLDLGMHVRPLPEDGSVPFLPAWRAVHTPGHTAGHVSLWREGDRVLLAGDACATMNQESWASTVLMPRELRWPPAPLTTDWTVAAQSLASLAALRPETIAAGHGLPMSGSAVAEALETLAAEFQPPADGRYVRQPALTDARGVVKLPPPVDDAVGVALRTGAAVTLIAGAALTLARSRRRASTDTTRARG